MKSASNPSPSSNSSSFPKCEWTRKENPMKFLLLYELIIITCRVCLGKEGLNHGETILNLATDYYQRSLPLSLSLSSSGPPRSRCKVFCCWFSATITRGEEEDSHYSASEYWSLYLNHRHLVWSQSYLPPISSANTFGRAAVTLCCCVLLPVALSLLQNDHVRRSFIHSMAE